MSPSQRATRGADEPSPPGRREPMPSSSSASYSAASAASIFCSSRLREESSSSADASPSNSRQRSSRAWRSDRFAGSVMAASQNQIDRSQSCRDQLEVNLVGQLTVETLRTN